MVKTFFCEQSSEVLVTCNCANNTKENQHQNDISSLFNSNIEIIEVTNCSHDAIDYLLKNVSIGLVRSIVLKLEKNGDQEPIDLSDKNENMGLYQFNKTNVTNENVNDINETATDVTFETTKNENNETAITEDNWFDSVGTVEETTENNHNQETISSEKVSIEIGDEEYKGPDSSDPIKRPLVHIIFYYLTIGLGILSGVLLMIIIAIIITVRLKSERCSSENNKKVSRAESWRYESSIYIKPPGNQVQANLLTNSQILSPQQQNVLNRSVAAAPSSLTNSPLMRPKNGMPGFRGVDVIRTTMPNPEDRLSYQRVREDSFDNYHINHHHNFPQEISDTDYPASSIDSEEDHGGDSATLPFR